MGAPSMLTPAGTGVFSIPSPPTDAPVAPVVLPGVPFGNSNSPIIVKGADIVAPQFLPPQPVVSPFPAPTFAYQAAKPAAHQPAPAPAAHVYNPAPAPARGGVVSSTDARAKDAMEMCAFAMAALKVRFYLLGYVSLLI
jgi:hypothetical protein